MSGKTKKHKMDIQKLFLHGQRCFDDCLEDVVDEEVEKTEFRWSDPTIWPEGRLPAEGEEVEVIAAWDLIYDLEEPSPIFRKLEINGILRFEDTADRVLNTNLLFVRAGKLIVGTQDEPF